MAVTPTISLQENTISLLPDNTTTVTLNTAASNNLAQTGVLSLELSPSVQINAGELYRFRVYASTTAAAQNSDLYVYLGTPLKSGLATAGYKAPSHFTTSTLEFPGLGDTKSEIDVYLLSKGSILADYNTLRVQLVDYNSSAGMDVTIYGGEITVADGGLADFGTGITLLNLGGAVTPAAGEVAPPDDPTAFATGSTVGESILLANDGSNAGMSSSANVTAAALVARMNTSATTGLWWEYQQFDVLQDIGTAGLNLDNLDTGLLTEPGKLYALSVYAKTSAPNTVMPNLIPYVVYDYTGLAGVSYNVGNFNSTHPSLTPDPGVQLAVQDKAYTVVFSPETPNDYAKTHLAVQLTYTGTDFVEGTTINISRIVLTEYDKPLD